MYTSSLYTILFLAALSVNASFTGFQNSTETLPACAVETATALDDDVDDTTTALFSTDAAGTTTAFSASSTSSAVLAATTSASVVIQVVEVEIVSFFVFIVNLGGAFPPSVHKNKGSENFIVFAEEFVELAPACSRACNHQFSQCSNSASSPHATFAVSDCQSQENNCLGVATTQSSTASTPATIKATATVVHARSSVAADSAATATTTAPAEVDDSEDDSEDDSGDDSEGEDDSSKEEESSDVEDSSEHEVAAAAVNNKSTEDTSSDCVPSTVTVTSMYYQCTAMTQQTVTATVTVTASASPTLVSRRLSLAERRGVRQF